MASGIPIPSDVIELYYDSEDYQWSDSLQATFTATSPELYVMIVAHKAGEDPMHLYIDNYALRQNWVSTLNCDPNNPNNTFAEERRYRYTFNGQEQENELNPSITSALYWMYDGRLGRRWNVDPRPNPSVSSYATFANNPIIFSDLLGDTTKIRVGGGDDIQEFEYRKGKVYKDGELYRKGTYASTDSKGKTTYLGFLGDAVNSLNKIGSKRNGAILLNVLEESKENYTIVSSNKNTYDHNKREVHWTGQSTNDIYGGESAAFIGLAHELGHGYDQEFNGIANFRKVWLEYISPRGTLENVFESEKIAGTIENLVRAEHGIKLRNSYMLSPQYEAQTRLVMFGTLSAPTIPMNPATISNFGGKKVTILRHPVPFIRFHDFNLNDGIKIR
jgi:hypothetical protein